MKYDNINVEIASSKCSKDSGSLLTAVLHEWILKICYHPNVIRHIACVPFLRLHARLQSMHRYDIFVLGLLSNLWIDHPIVHDFLHAS